MDTLTSKITRRRHSAEFKQQVVDACRQPGASVAGVALAHGVNANLVRRWRVAHGVVPPSRRSTLKESAEFVPLRIEPAESLPRDIRIEVRRGVTTVILHWPLAAASDCGTWLQAWLR